ncbi:cytochrome P450 6B3 [Culex quinquefasciatus]|uniref:Cytochrome P450 6B3 n=1 Tax=Culex quinquefasciatus TaxID=7176 RepID=B0XE68_CULQU|nr:cytochrome P450 6B3 [Culex quinquefasciatus]|eukprot:XP_001867940.1 cytochrome P450 6B3 [Culex quinquefasciatus]
MILTVTLLCALSYAAPRLGLLVTVAGFACRALLNLHFQHWRRRNVPGPEPSVLTGNLGPTFSQTKHLAELCDEWYHEYPGEPFVGFYKVFTPGVMIRAPDLVKAVLVRDYASFSANDFPVDAEADPLLIYNPFVVDGDRWRKSRQLLSPLYTASRMRQLFPAMERICDQLVEYVGGHVGRDLEAKAVSATFTTQNVARCAFSVDADCFRNPDSEWRVMGRKVFQPSLLAGIKYMLVLFLPFLTNVLSVSITPKEVNEWMINLVSGLLKERKNSKKETEDQLQTLLNTKSKIELNEELIAGQALSFFTEGFETSSAALGFLIYSLAANPHVQDKLYDEIEQALKSYDNTVSYAMVQKLDYLDWTLQESLRIKPPLGVMQKQATKDYILKREINGQLEGIWIRAGTPVLIPLLSIQNDPSYFPNPDEFRPERFDPREKTTDPGRMVYFPLGEGPRMCVGMRFAQTQIKLALVRLMLNFRIVVSPNHKPFRMDAGKFPVESRDGLLVRFEKRE